MAHDTKMSDDNMDMNDDSMMSQQEREKLQQSMSESDDKDMGDKKAM